MEIQIDTGAKTHNVVDDASTRDGANTIYCTQLENGQCTPNNYFLKMNNAQNRTVTPKKKRSTGSESYGNPSFMPKYFQTIV